ncbi:MAG: hypothetical protein JWN70_436 [Planctomycetaceae bacterium]|nr:hypothetical protein [Planctomycetaceae bacterium]
MINLGTYTIHVSHLSSTWHSKNHPINEYFNMTPTLIAESLLSEFSRLGATGWELAQVTLWSHVWRGTGEDRTCHDRMIIELPLSGMSKA